MCKEYCSPCGSCPHVKLLMGFQGHHVSLGSIYLGICWSYVSIKISVDSDRLLDILSAFLVMNTCYQCKYKVKFQGNRSFRNCSLQTLQETNLLVGRIFPTGELFKWRKKVKREWEQREELGMGQEWSVTMLSLNSHNHRWKLDEVLWFSMIRILFEQALLWSTKGLWHRGWTHGQNLVYCFGVLKNLLYYQTVDSSYSL